MLTLAGISQTEDAAKLRRTHFPNGAKGGGRKGASKGGGKSEKTSPPKSE